MAGEYTIHRRVPGSSTWGDPIADTSGVETVEDGLRRFVDNALETGRVYEYSVAAGFVANPATRAAHTAYGYTLAGIRAPLVERRGTLVLMVEQSLSEPLAAEINRLQNDLIGDRWRVIRQSADRRLL